MAKKKKRKVANPLQIATQLTYRHLTTPTKKEKQEREYKKYKGGKNLCYLNI